MKHLIQKWRKLANEHRDDVKAIQAERDQPFGYDEESCMHELEAKTLEKCADELARVDEILSDTRHPVAKVARLVALGFSDTEAHDLVEPPMDSETKTVLEDIPYCVPDNEPIGEPALIHIDKYGRLSIWPQKGGWLGCDLKDVKGDLAPFCD